MNNSLAQAYQGSWPVYSHEPAVLTANTSLVWATFELDNVYNDLHAFKIWAPQSELLASYNIDIWTSRSPQYDAPGSRLCATAVTLLLGDGRPAYVRCDGASARYVTLLRRPVGSVSEGLAVQGIEVVTRGE